MDDISVNIIPIIQQYGVRKAAIFGSYAKGLADESSDVDLLIEYPKGLGLFGLLDLKYALEDALTKKVDLVTYSGLHPYLRDRILAEQKIIYEE